MEGGPGVTGFHLSYQPFPSGLSLFTVFLGQEFLSQSMHILRDMLLSQSMHILRDMLLSESMHTLRDGIPGLPAETAQCTHSGTDL